MRLAALLLCLATSASADGWTQPARGTDLRADLLDAIRPKIEWTVGGPVEFVVWDLRVTETAAFASLMAQHPGGGVIDLYQTPGARRGEIDPDVGDGATVQALLTLSGRTWVAVHVGINSTDAWWHYEDFCPIWHEVIPEACP
ncbi:hypothetical protein [Roseovarius sp. Pro17]|uniref:hypothetical protein n=1 Tax=Roseovarius sp. Pro17 TaxID=3108175 RepID=UPI002D789FE7|nr:hypothetical protein [Roseovarius sp. Pro17]